MVNGVSLFLDEESVSKALQLLHEERPDGWQILVSDAAVSKHSFRKMRMLYKHAELRNSALTAIIYQFQGYINLLQMSLLARATMHTFLDHYLVCSMERLTISIKLMWPGRLQTKQKGRWPQ